MKKVLVLLVLGLAMMSCSKEEIDNVDNSPMLVDELIGKTYTEDGSTFGMGYYFEQDDIFMAWVETDFNCVMKYSLEQDRVITSTANNYAVAFTNANGGECSITVTRGITDEMIIVWSIPGLVYEFEAYLLLTPMCNQ